MHNSFGQSNIFAHENKSNRGDDSKMVQLAIPRSFPSIEEATIP